MTSAFAPAKINLTLHVTGRRADGYHLLDSLVVFANVGDRITVAAADGMSLDVTGPERAGVPCDATNLVWRAAQAAGLRARITLEKHLPSAAGIGGGSSDAAATLRAAQALGGTLPDPLTLGADVPVCMAHATQRMRGIGEVLDPAPELPQLWIVLINPRIGTPTPAVFKALETRDNPPMEATLPKWKDTAEFIHWLGTTRNDLQAPAIAQVPQIADVLDALRPALFARMSGSGATCFGLFESAQAAAKSARGIAEAHPDWWVADAQLMRETT